MIPDRNKFLVATIVVMGIALLFLSTRQHMFQPGSDSHEADLGDFSSHPTPRSTSESQKPKQVETGKEGISVPAGLDPATAEQLLKESARRHPDIVDRSKYCCGIIRSLCQAGYSEEAWGLMEQNVGMLRRGELAQFFASAQLPDENLISKLREDMTELTASVSGYFRRFDPHDLKGIVSSGKIQQALAGHIHENDIELGLIMNLQLATTRADKKDRGALVDVAVDLHESGLIGDHSFYQIVNRSSLGNAFDRWELLADSRFKDSRDDRSLRETMINNMVEQDAEKTMTLIAGGSRNTSTADLKSAMSSWLGVDSKSANSWYASNLSTFSQQQRDAISEANFSQAIEYKEKDSAISWLNQISNPELKTSLAEKINELK